MKTNAKDKPKDTAPPLFEIKNLLVALKLTPTDESILNYLHFLAEKISIKKADILHVIPKVMLFKDTLEFDDNAAVLGNYELNEDVIQKLKQEVEGRFSEHKTEVTFDVREGEPLEELLKEAAEEDTNLILTGQNTSQFSHGILAKNLARKVKCNALVVPHEALPSMKKILVPIDFSMHSVEALQTALKLSKSMGKKTEIIALHVYETPNISSYQLSRSIKQFESMIKQNREDAFRRFLKTYAKEDEDDIQITLIKQEKPGVGHYIIEFARENQIELIVMGAKGHSRVELLLLGSVTEKVLSLDKKIPVWVVK